MKLHKYIIIGMMIISCELCSMECPLQNNKESNTDQNISYVGIGQQYLNLIGRDDSNIHVEWGEGSLKQIGLGKPHVVGLLPLDEEDEEYSWKKQGLYGTLLVGGLVATGFVLKKMFFYSNK